MFYLSFKAKLLIIAEAIIEFFCIWFLIWVVISTMILIFWKFSVLAYDVNQSSHEFVAFLIASMIKFFQIKGREITRRQTAQIYLRPPIGGKILIDIKNNYDYLKRKMDDAVTLDDDGNIVRDHRRFVVREFVYKTHNQKIFEKFTAVEGIRFVEAGMKEYQTVFETQT